MRKLKRSRVFWFVLGAVVPTALIAWRHEATAGQVRQPLAHAAWLPKPKA